MTRSTADQIIERIANAKGLEPAVMRQQLEQALQNIIADTTNPSCSILAELFPGGKPTVDEFVVKLECLLYTMMIPGYPEQRWRT